MDKIGWIKNENFHASDPSEKQNRPRFHQKTAKTANSVDRIIKKQKKLRIPWTESSKNGKNRLSSTDDERKTVKTAFPPRGKSKNTQKPRFPPEGKSKSSKNCVSPRREKQNHPKTAFPPRGKVKHTQKLPFHHGRRYVGLQNSF